MSRTRHLAFVFLPLFALCCGVSGSHFRGGTISWKADDKVPGKVDFLFKLAWRRSHAGNFDCDNSTISTRRLLGDSSYYWVCYGCNDRYKLATSQFYCTGYSVAEDWTQGENTFEESFVGSGPFIVRFKDQAWINNLIGVSVKDPDYVLATTVNLAVRRDTKKINSSPISATSPVFQLQQHCSYSLPVLTNDPDGDTVKCRWAKGFNECGGVCGEIPFSILDPTPCVLHFSASTIGVYAVALTLEDFGDPALVSAAPLSQVPLQFLINVTAKANGTKCGAGIRFADSTISEGECVTLKPNETYSARIEVVEDAGASVGEVMLIAPLGLRRSSPVLGSHPNKYFDVKWTPTSSQNGVHTFCFSVTDLKGISTSLRCITLLAGANPPEFVKGSFSPGNKFVDVYQKKFSIAFNQEIKRPTASKYIRLYSTNVTATNDLPSASSRLLATLDSSVSSSVLVLERKLTIYLPFSLELVPEMIHFITLDYGVVVGLQACGQSGAPFRGLPKKTWVFTAGKVNSNPCAANRGKGSCQVFCTKRKNGSYNCSCPAGEVLAPNKHTCYLPNGETSCPYNCSGNGVCLGNFCSCRFGWLGESCSEPACYNHASCSYHGECVQPNTCLCYSRWEGPACSVDRCSVHSSCATCTKVIGCGWCDSTQRCISGSGGGPTDPNVVCQSYLYYSCQIFVGDGYDASATSCSDHVSLVDCEDCLDDQRLAAKGPGSFQYCEASEAFCKIYGSCFTRENPNVCPTWNEEKCPFGVPLLAKEKRLLLQGSGRSRRDNQNEEKILPFTSYRCDGHDIINLLDSKLATIGAINGAIRLTSELLVDLSPDEDSLLTDIASVESNFGKNKNTFRDISQIHPPYCNRDGTVLHKYRNIGGLGIWQVDLSFYCDFMKRSGQKVFRERNEVIKQKMNIDLTKTTPEDLFNPLVNVLFARLKLASSARSTKLKDRCGENLKFNYNDDCSDGIGVEVCKRALRWYYCYNGRGATKTNDGKLPDLPKEGTKKFSQQRSHVEPKVDKGCVNGQRDPATDCRTCICEKGYTGDACDLLDCGCANNCGTFGTCKRQRDGSNRCDCSFFWRGQCCTDFLLAFVYGDPHLRTLDGLEYDYFGIGVFWGCISRENDFGYQLGFFEYRRTSLLGAVAVNAGGSVVTIVSIGDSSGLNRPPTLRVNRRLQSFSSGNRTVVVAGVTLYSNFSSTYTYRFQFRNGETLTVEAAYSDILRRQHLSFSVGATITLLHKTQGLCGIFDGSVNNDMTGSTGVLYRNSDSFGDSWRVKSLPASAGSKWSWNSSNFYPLDLKSSDYFDPHHVPQYDLSSYSSWRINNAKLDCQAKGLTDEFFDDCVLDIVVTGDSSFADQTAFDLGKCPNDCHNRGECDNGTCHCSGLWKGDDCSRGGCDDCPENSRCREGFCECLLGYFINQKLCNKATCLGVANCTSPLYGRCTGIDKCLCSPGYTGPSCNQRITCSVPNRCSSHGVCLEDDKCLCDPNWGGDDCSVPTCGNLQNCSGNGQCNANGTCDCFAGFSGSSCSVPTCHDVGNCSSNGLCVSPNQCRCTGGYSLPNCSSKIECPSLGNCSGNGICLSPSRCLCYDGYAGLSCLYPLCPGGCSGQGKCKDAYFCECNSGWTGQDCSQPSCETFSYCSGNGVCADFDSCNCSADWTGLACDVPTCYSENNILQCNGRGKCVGPGVCDCNLGYFGDLCENKVNGFCLDKWTCFCLIGWTGSLCTEPICTSLSNCSNHGICSAPGVCTCSVNYSGVDCSVPLCSNNCSSNGICVNPNECSCHYSYYGSDCSQAFCFGNCSSHGICTSPNVCTCSIDYSGVDCSVPLCYNNCSGNGVCVNPGECSCYDFYSGSDCSNIVCPGDCSGNGICSGPDNCTCYTGFSGDDCSTPLCPSNCTGKGQCAAPGKCFCDKGYSGSDCSLPVCLGNCSDHGRCTDANVCSCDEGFAGSFCDLSVSTNQESGVAVWIPLSASVIVLAVLGIVLIVVVLVFS